MLSIIIPVYNGIGHFLPECLNSIWMQNLSESLYEVICVNDCSKDTTLAFLTEEKLEHVNLQIIDNKTNIRQGGGRNRGVIKAKGKWVMFIDQDDYFENNSLLQVISSLKSENIDILIADSTCHLRGSNSNKLQVGYKFKEISYAEKFYTYNGLVVSPWRYIINRNYFLSHQCFFEENVRIEDVDWACRLISENPIIKYEPFVLVHYIQNFNNTTSALLTDEKVLLDNIKATQRAQKVLDKSLPTSIRRRIFEVVDRYYKNSFYSMLFIKIPVQLKKNLITQIVPYRSKYLINRFALNAPLIFSIFSNIIRYPLMVLRKLKKVYIARWLN